MKYDEENKLWYGAEKNGVSVKFLVTNVALSLADKWNTIVLLTVIYVYPEQPKLKQSASSSCYNNLC